VAQLRRRLLLTLAADENQNTTKMSNDEQRSNCTTATLMRLFMSCIIYVTATPATFT